MKKPTRRNASKALCAYFTLDPFVAGFCFPQGKGIGLQLGGTMPTQLTLDFNFNHSIQQGAFHVLSL